MNTSIPAAEFKRRFSDFLGRVIFKHERFVITRRGRPVAQITPLEDMPQHIGQVKGWLEDSDPFFNIVDSIVADRRKHKPRVFSDPK
jgi:prevent-host-death family protein